MIMLFIMLNEYNERLNFVNRMKTQLTLMQLLNETSAIKELVIRLNVYLATGRPDNGTINYPEANAKIYYSFTEIPKKGYIRMK